MAGRGWPGLSWPGRWWARQSLRARLTLLATTLFTFAVLTGAVLLIVLQKYALVRVLDSSAQKTATDVARQFITGKNPTNVLPTTGGVTAVQVVNANDVVIAASPGADRITPVLNTEQLRAARNGTRFDIASTTSDGRLRVLAARAGDKTVLVVTDLSRVDDSVRIVTRAALIGGPLAVLLMGFASYAVVALTLRPVAALRHGAADITAAGLADQRLPVPGAKDEIHRLAITLNAMLDRIDSATARQRTFVGDAAHELRSPLASLRVQLEVAQRLGPESDWNGLIDDVMVDVKRLDRLVEDLLALARVDEAGEPRREPVQLDALITTVVGGYMQAHVPVTTTGEHDVEIVGDPDGLHRVVVNLIDNALRYARSGVVIDLQRASLAGRPIVRLTVTDDGPGIPAAERKRVFDRFYRITQARDRESGGTGLGLPIVRDVARAHGGSVRLTDRPDGADGLQAVVVLPADPRG
jgi:signal transduction histidine kinase